MSINKDLQALKRKAEAQGWTVENLSGGHLRWTPPNDSDPIITAKTPSTSGIVATIKSQLVAAGLELDASKFKREQKKPAAGGLVLEDQSIERPPGKQRQFQNMTDDEILAQYEAAYGTEWFLMQTPRQLAMMVTIAREFDQWYRHCTCGSEFTNTIALFTHVVAKNGPEHQPCRPGDAQTPVADAPTAPDAAPVADVPGGDGSSAPSTHPAPETGLETAIKTSVDSGLTDLEHQAIEKLAEAWNLMVQIVGNDPASRENDLAELAHGIHVLQTRIMAQAAARAHPDLYRLLGEVIGGRPDE